MDSVIEMDPKLEMLSARIASIELLLHGKMIESSSSSGDSSAINHTNTSQAVTLNRLHDSIERIVGVTDRLDIDIPSFIECQKLSNQVKQMIIKRDDSIAQVNVLLSSKHELENCISQLGSIEMSSSVVDKTSVFDTDIELRNQLNEIESLLQPLITRCRIQAEDLSTFLEAYETAISTTSELCIKWDTVLKSENITRC